MKTVLTFVIVFALSILSALSQEDGAETRKKEINESFWGILHNF